MTDVADMQDAPEAAPDGTVSGGGGVDAAPAPAPIDPVDQAVAHLELLSVDAREAVLGRMDAGLAERIRNRMDSTPDRPHGAFSRDVVERRRMLREMTERIHSTNATRQQQAVDQSAIDAARPTPVGMPADMHAGAVPAQPNYAGAAPVPGMPIAAPAAIAPTGDPLDSLRVLHPAAIARAMQGERAEAWAIVLDRLDVNARAALQLYLDATARVAIDDARARQADLAATAPQLVATIEAAIARTVVPRAMREHHQLLSTTPITWDASGGTGAWA